MSIQQSHNLSPEQQTKLQALLLEKLQEFQLKNPQFSQRALAKKLNLSSGALSEIINGRRGLSYDKIKDIFTKLMIDPDKQLSIIETKKSNKSKKPGSAELDRKNYVSLNMDQYLILAEWWHYAILSLIKTKSFKYDISWIADRLGVSPTQTQTAIDRMLRLEMLEEVKLRGSGKKLRRTDVKYSTSEDIANISIRKFHHQGLAKAAEALDHVPVELRDFSSFTVPTDPSKLKMVKEKLRKFQAEIAEDLMGSAADEVYQVNMQVFPVTKVKIQGGKIK